MIREHSRRCEGVRLDSEIEDKGRQYYEKDHRRGNRQVWLSTGTSFQVPTVWSTVRITDPVVGDFNGDGRSDIAGVSGGVVRVLLSTGKDFQDAGTWASGIGGFMRAIDINGDGRDDLVEMQKGGSVVKIWLAGDKKFVLTGQYDMGSSSSKYLGDFNGDGFGDVLVIKNRKAFVRLGTPDGLGPLVKWGQDFAAEKLLVGDFNGDGMADIIEFRGSWNAATALVWLSMGSKFAGPFAWADTAKNWGKLGDFNGDGKTDFAQWQVDYSYVWLAK